MHPHGQAHAFAQPSLQIGVVWTLTPVCLSWCVCLFFFCSSRSSGQQISPQNQSNQSIRFLAQWWDYIDPDVDPGHEGPWFLLSGFILCDNACQRFTWHKNSLPFTVSLLNHRYFRWLAEMINKWENVFTWLLCISKNQQILSLTCADNKRKHLLNTALVCLWNKNVIKSFG